MEEGTETLEPYIVASLTEYVQHLILIGKYLIFFFIALPPKYMWLAI